MGLRFLGCFRDFTTDWVICSTIESFDSSGVAFGSFDPTPSDSFSFKRLDKTGSLIDEGIFGLPSVSGLATIAILALAGIVVAQRNRDEE